jgi:hypothetical protein
MTHLLIDAPPPDDDENEHRYKRPPGESLSFLLVIPLIAACWALLRLWYRFLPRISEEVQTTRGRFVAMSLLLALAVALFGLRVRRRSIYGVVELAVGLFIAWRSLDSVKPGAGPLAAGATLMAGVYLIIRAFDNIHQGREGERKRQTELGAQSGKVLQAVEHRGSSA